MEACSLNSKDFTCLCAQQQTESGVNYTKSFQVFLLSSVQLPYSHFFSVVIFFYQLKYKHNVNKIGYLSLTGSNSYMFYRLFFEGRGEGGTP